MLVVCALALLALALPATCSLKRTRTSRDDLNKLADEKPSDCPQVTTNDLPDLGNLFIGEEGEQGPKIQKVDESYSTDWLLQLLKSASFARSIRNALRAPSLMVTLPAQHKSMLRALEGRRGVVASERFLDHILQHYDVGNIGAERESSAFFWSSLIFSSFCEFSQKNPHYANEALNLILSAGYISRQPAGKEYMIFAEGLFKEHACQNEISRSFSQRRLGCSRETAFQEFLPVGGKGDNEQNFIYAAGQGHTETVKHLAHMGVRSETAYRKAFIWAAKGGHLETMKWLYVSEVGAGSITRAHIELTMCEAALVGRTAVVEHLIKEQGANPNAQDGMALYWAGVNLCVDTVAYLLREHGAVFSKEVKEKVLLHAKNYNCSEIVEVFESVHFKLDDHYEPGLDDGCELRLDDV